jgi:hypothetical protein
MLPKQNQWLYIAFFVAFSEWQNLEIVFFYAELINKCGLRTWVAIICSCKPPILRTAKQKAFLLAEIFV